MCIINVCTTGMIQSFKTISSLEMNNFIHCSPQQKFRYTLYYLILQSKIVPTREKIFITTHFNIINVYCDFTSALVFISVIYTLTLIYVHMHMKLMRELTYI